MHRRALISSLFFAFFAFVPARAQQGHPLTGTWSGDWGPTGARRIAITLVMNWDGKNVTGIINPGPDSIQIASVYVDYANWTVRIQADAKDSSGKTVHISAEGKLDDLGSYHRTIQGIWEQGTVKGEFLLTRD
ncbi:MAG TPA: hypothetical protein VH640_18670 [Bryobacteraceae bacterium]